MIKKVLKNDYAFAMILKFVCVILGFLYTIILSRYLGSSLRGEYSIIQNYANIIAIFIGFGIYQSYPYLKRKTDNYEEKKNVYKNIVQNVLGLFLLYLIVCIILIILLPIETRYKITLAIIPTTYLYKQLNYILLIEYPRSCNKTDVLLSIIDIVIVSICMFFTKANLFYCCLILIISKAVYALLPIKNLRINICNHSPKIDQNIKKYIKLGFIPMITVILMTFNHKIDIVMLSFFKNVTVSEIGIYSLGVMLAEKIWMLPDTLTSILQSKLAGGKKEDEVAKISRISFFITAICLIIVAIIGKPLILFAYGKEYIDAYKITLIILVGVLGMTFYKVVYAYNIVMGKRKLNFIILVLSVLINIVLNYILISKIGTIGAGYASLISFVICGSVFLMTFSISTKTKILDMIVFKKDDIILLKNTFFKRGK